MTDGLKKILARVAETPTSTMIDRYLALVSELPNEQEKTERVLDLGEGLLIKAPTEALRVVGMVHDAAPKNIRAYDILIAAFEKLGRAAKAGVLRVERDKLSAAALIDNAKSDVEEDVVSTEHTPPPALLEFDLLTPESGLADALDSSLSNLDLGDDTQTLAFPSPEDTESLKVDMLDSNPEPSTSTGSKPLKLGRSKSSSLSKLQGAVEGLLRDRTPSRVGSAIKSANSSRNPFAATKGEDFPSPKTTASTRVSQALNKADESIPTADRTSVSVPPVGMAFLSLDDPSQVGIASSTSGSLDPERLDLLAREAQEAFGTVAEPKSGEGQGRPKFGPTDEARPFQAFAGSDLSATNLADLGDVSSFWDPLHAMMAKVNWDQAIDTQHQQRINLLSQMERAAPLKFSVPPELINSIRTQFQQLVVTEPTMALKQAWDVMQGIWGEKPDGITIALLRELNLSRATRGFWGFYLDALLARGAGRKVLVEVATVVARERQLSWAKTGWQRLPTAWRQLGVRGFDWQEDEGVDALLNRLSQRPRQTLRSLLLSA